MGVRTTIVVADEPIGRPKSWQRVEYPRRFDKRNGSQQL